VSIAHECKCGLVSPVPESQGGKRIRCKGCGTISVVLIPEVLEPDPVPVAAGATKADSAPPPPPPKAHRYRRKLTREEERADYPRTGGVIDWRKVHEGDDGDYHHDPVPPDPQTRYLNQPEGNAGGRVVSVALGGLMVIGSLIWVLLSFVVFARLPFVGLATAVGLFVVGCGVLVRGLFGRSV
jgi:hypothetical protein